MILVYAAGQFFFCLDTSIYTIKGIFIRKYFNPIQRKSKIRGKKNESKTKAAEFFIF